MKYEAFAVVGATALIEMLIHYNDKKFKMNNVESNNTGYNKKGRVLGAVGTLTGIYLNALGLALILWIYYGFKAVRSIEFNDKYYIKPDNNSE